MNGNNLETQKEIQHKHGHPCASKWALCPAEGQTLIADSDSEGDMPCNDIYTVCHD